MTTPKPIPDRPDDGGLPGSRWKAAVREALEGTSPVVGRKVVLALQGLIVLSVLSIGIETLPGLRPGVSRALAALETVTIIVFTAEYLVRLVVTPRPLRYVFSFWGLIDLLAILPYYLLTGVDLRSLRAFRLLRLFRLFKLTRYTAAADRLAVALRGVVGELALFTCVALVITYICALCIYYFEHDAQPEAFASVFHAMWWAAVTLTTVGYGDVVPVTAGGRIFTVLLLFVAVGVVAVPTGLVAAALTRLREPEAGKASGERETPPAT